MPERPEDDADEACLRRRAREIWESEGRPEGRDLDHWQRAERDLATEAARRQLAKDMDTEAATGALKPPSPPPER